MGLEDKHFPSLIAICFITNFLLGVTGAIIMNAHLLLATIVWQISNMFYVAGCALLSLKAGSERKHISAAGFILLSIDMTTFFSLQTSFSEDTNPIYASGVLIMLPGLVFIMYYNVFPLWVRIAGILAGIPRLILLIDQYMDSFKIERNGLLDGLGYTMMGLLGLFWVYYTYKDQQKEETSQ